MTLYLKYRSQRLEDLDLTEVRESLKKMIASGNIPHAFLFSGPKGTGKTSGARILAKILNCESISVKLRGEGLHEPCNECGQCISITKGENLDVIELDAASNRGIDDIRALRDTVKLSPALAKKKVYIIDEAHMLTTEASNALLKTLEEPPAHVVFILATTNPEKLIETIRSRTTTVQFKKAGNEEIMRSLKRVVKGENIKVADEVLALVAKAANGAFRDAHKTLEHLLTSDIDIKDREVVEELLFKNKIADPILLIKLLEDKKTTDAISLVEKAIAGGMDVDGLTDLVIEELHKILLSMVNSGQDIESNLSKKEVVNLLHSLFRVKSELKNALLEQIPLEILIVEWCEKDKIVGVDDDREQSVENKNKDIKEVSEMSVNIRSSGLKDDSEKSGKINIKDTNNQLTDKKVEKVIEKLEETDDVRIENGAATVAELNDGIWSKVLNEIRPKNASTEALLRAARPLNFNGKVLTLGVFYSFHKEKLEANPHRDILEETISANIGIPIRVICELTEQPKQSTEMDQIQRSEESEEVVLSDSEDEDIMKVAEEIFGN